MSRQQIIQVTDNLDYFVLKTSTHPIRFGLDDRNCETVLSERLRAAVAEFIEAGRVVRRSTR